MKFSTKIAAFLLVAGMATLSSVHGQPSRPTYAVLSLAGDALSLHAVRHGTGSRAETPARHLIPIDDAVFDGAIIRSAGALVARQQPDSRQVLMLTQDKGLFLAQDSMFDQADAHAEDRAYLLGLLKAQGASHLVLVTKWRSNAELTLTDKTSRAGGVFEGLGFYIDDTLNLRNLGTRETSRGMYAPFAYLRLRLLDAQSLAVLKDATVKAYRVEASPSVESSGMDSWTALGTEAKVDAIRAVIDDALGKKLPELLPR